MISKSDESELDRSSLSTQSLASLKWIT
jgi:hypothetical protein